MSNTETIIGSKNKRIESLDALRGAAVLGIFIINIIVLGISDAAVSNPYAHADDSTLNHGIWVFTTIFAEGAMRGLFSLMFGASVILYCTRSDDPAKIKNVRTLYYRRNILLIIFGLIHSSLLLNPLDILFVYGLVGLILYPMRNLRPAILCVTSAIVLIFMVLSWGEELYIEMEVAEQAQAIETKFENGEVLSEQDQEILDHWHQILEYYSPSEEAYKQAVDDRTTDIATLYKSNDRNDDEDALGQLIFYAFDALLMMLVGMAFYKWRILTGERSRQFYLKLALFGYAAGISLRAIIITDSWANDFMPGSSMIMCLSPVGRVAMSIGHVGLFFLLWNLFSSTLIMRALTAAGRMALSNYIVQTLVMSFLFTSLGLSLYGQFDRAQLYGIMILVWTAQLTLSVAWLKRYKMGPLEWLWRILTYIKLIPNRR